MRKRYHIAIFVSALIAIFAVSACAQYEATDKSRVGIKMVYWMPSDSALSELTSSWIGPIIDVNITFDKFDKPNTIFSFGWFGENQGGLSTNYIPLTASYIHRLGNNPEKGFYVGGGLGAYMLKYRVFDAGGTGTNYGLNLFAGYEINSAWFAEIRYDMIDKFEAPFLGDIDFSGMSVSIGSRLTF